ncbi:hypothetical protein [Actinoallomurus sp. CA-150999]|uniref:tRNA ligase subunit PheS family protein n=1 Tax=Actinoallomurus sp. CA-150999 TaxID=3239887 RepID=UPI003D906949
MRDRPAEGRDPVAALAEEIVDLFTADGYRFAEGPELEAEWFNFDALNMDADHPSRGTAKAFPIEGPSGRSGLVLRGHTSPVQVREMLTRPVPLRMVTVGRVFRPDPLDATHSPVFHQAEVLAVAEDLGMDDLRDTLGRFATAMFGRRAPVRLRPHRFAYTDPSAEADVRCPACQGRACELCGDGWVEWAGCGMVHPRVLVTCGIDPRRYTGLAFGAGVERTLMLRHGLNDIRDVIGHDGSHPANRPPPRRRVPDSSGPASPFRRRQATAHALTAAGWAETRTDPFLDPAIWDTFGLPQDDPRRAQLHVTNPLDGRPSALRTSLLPGVLIALRTRTRHASGELRLFEQGTVFLSPPAGLRPQPPTPPTGGPPSPERLAALRAAIPAQPCRLAAALTGAGHWQAIIPVIQAVGRQWDVSLRPERGPRGGTPPWRDGRWACVVSGGTPVGEAGELDPAVLRRLSFPDGVAALTLDLDAMNRLNGEERT